MSCLRKPKFIKVALKNIDDLKGILESHGFKLEDSAYKFTPHYVCLAQRYLMDKFSDEAYNHGKKSDSKVSEFLYGADKGSYLLFTSTYLNQLCWAIQCSEGVRIEKVYLEDLEEDKSRIMHETEGKIDLELFHR